jgi:hypothetical protein
VNSQIKDFLIYILLGKANEIQKLLLLMLKDDKEVKKEVLLEVIDMGSGKPEIK